MFAFCHDANPEIIWECFGFDPPWNDWASPIVDCQTLFDVLQDAEWCIRPEGAIIFVAPDEGTPEDEVVVLAPDDEARYHLRDLGWTFLESKAYDTKVLPFKRPE